MKRISTRKPIERIAPDDAMMAIPQMPIEPCWLCCESVYHLNMAGNAWLCNRCHPIILPVYDERKRE